MVDYQVPSQTCDCRGLDTLWDCKGVSVGICWDTSLFYIWGLSKIMVPENCPYAALSRTFRAPAESGHGIMIGFSFIYRFINSTMRPFANLTPRFRGLSPLQQNIHIHICRCHSDTKSLAWVLGRLPYNPNMGIYIYICIHNYIYIYTHV